jgi:hypothetical protein
MAKRPDIFSGNLFEKPENPNVPEILQPRKGGKPGEMVDSKGIIYDRAGNVIGEEPSKELLKALEAVRAAHPGENIAPDDPEVQHYVRRFRLEAKQAERARKRREREKRKQKTL